MSAIPKHRRPIRTAAHAWFDQNLPELTSRCNAYFRHRPALEREEATADTLAAVFRYAIGAEARGKLSLLTCYTLVSFFGRAYCEGRRMAGYSSTDVMSEAARRRHGLRVISLEEMHDSPTTNTRNPDSISEMLADSKVDRPPENVRRNLDYLEILERSQASTKAKRVFRFLCETAGEGRQIELAREMRVAPSRITQLKAELALSLAAHGYAPLGWSPSEPRRMCASGRSVRRPAQHLREIPLNPGTTPPRGRNRSNRPVAVVV